MRWQCTPLSHSSSHHGYACRAHQHRPEGFCRGHPLSSGVEGYVQGQVCAVIHTVGGRESLRVETLGLALIGLRASGVWDGSGHQVGMI